MRPLVTACFLIALGAILALFALLQPGEAHWSLADPARHEHVTSLGRDHNGRLHAGTQSGRLWRLQGESGWQDLGSTPDGVAVTVLAPGKSGLLVGTANGLFHWNGTWQRLLDTGRISDAGIYGPDGGLVVAVENRVLEYRGDTWRDTAIGDAIGGTSVYRATIAETYTGVALQAGTVGRGVWTRLPGTAAWRGNNEGLPAEAKVFSFAVAGNGLLLAGTDQGLYWQKAPFAPWHPIDDGLGGRRVLDLARQDHPSGARLMAASDDGVYSIRLVERPQSLETQGRWQRMTAASGGLDRPVAWIEPDLDTVWISAGSIYRLAWARSYLRYIGIAIGVAMAMLGLYLIVSGRKRGRTHASL